MAHCLLFGQYIEIKKVQGKWLPRTNIKRWWKGDWKGFFEEFLNIDAVHRDCMPSLMGWRQKLLDTFESENMSPDLNRVRELLIRKTTSNRRRTL